MSAVQKVHIEFSRVQTWLFAVPRLRAMVGANALLGTSLRVTLRDLARESGQGWSLAPSNEAYPGADENDPLKDHDDPAGDAKAGILSRDGGHFEALFGNGAERFAEAAARRLRKDLPGLRFRISIDRQPRVTSRVHLSTELPVLAPCEWTGRGVASAIVTRGKPNQEDYEERSVSLDVFAREIAGERAAKGDAPDLASLLSVHTKLHALERAQELKELVGDGYLALIHADGNGVGGGPGKDRSDSERAAFFHRNRVLLRRAVQKAVDVACAADEQRRSVQAAKAKVSKVFAPLIPLMLGGDDLLLVARAEIALPFVVALCAELDALQKDSTGFKLTLGAGVVIAKHTIPIHRLHEVAEHLAGSAKRRYRGFREAEARCSVVDWAVYSTAWVDDPDMVRRRDWIRGSDSERRVLSQRPLNVLGGGLDALQGLVQSAETLEGAPRSQLRYLVDQLARGRVLTELAHQELSPLAAQALRKAGLEAPWRRAEDAWTTPLLDLVEIAEIRRLGSGVERSDHQEEPLHG